MNNQQQHLSVRQFVFATLTLIFTSAIYAAVYFAIPTTIRGFFTCDSKLSYPYRKSTVPSWLNLFLAVAIPLVLMLAIRLYRTFRLSPSLEPPKTYTLHFWSSRTFSINEIWLGFAYEFFGLAFGLLIECVIADILKHTVGELRPYFMAACTPQYSNHSLTGSCPYVGQYNCTNQNNLEKHAIYELRKSFPSNHAGTIFFGMVFACVIVHYNWKWINTRAVAYLTMGACISLAVFVGASRVMDNKHFPHDVLAGAILGTITGYFAALKSVKSI